MPSYMVQNARMTAVWDSKATESTFWWEADGGVQPFRIMGGGGRGLRDYYCCDGWSGGGGHSSCKCSMLSFGMSKYVEENRNVHFEVWSLARSARVAWDSKSLSESFWKRNWKGLWFTEGLAWSVSRPWRATTTAAFRDTGMERGVVGIGAFRRHEGSLVKAVYVL